MFVFIYNGDDEDWYNVCWWIGWVVVVIVGLDGRVGKRCGLWKIDVVDIAGIVGWCITRCTTYIIYI